MCLLDFLCFRNSVEKLCVSWALSLVEYVAVGALKLPVPSTDVLKTHESQSFSAELLEFQKKLTKNVRSLPIFVRSRILESVIVRMCYHCK